MSGSAEAAFAQRLIDWQQRHGRHDLPWQESRDPYRIWLSEIMLQQTQVAAVIPYYQRFLARFPDVLSLAQAPLDEVLAHWSGLGYYARARNLHRAAIAIKELHDGQFPLSSAALVELPGIGRSTAAAIAAFAAGERAAILDGNVKRVLTRHFAIEGFPGQTAIERQLWRLAESLLPAAGIEAYTQGLMDLGATVCTRARPRCPECPLAASCAARAADAVAQYPQARPRRTRPERQTTLWLLRAGKAPHEYLLLERRPPVGIWGGLWSLPEAPPPGLELEVAGPPLQLTHGFTHFILHITVEQRHARLLPTSGVLAEGASGQRWQPWTQALGLGLPAPIRTILEHLARAPDLLGSAAVRD